MSELTVSAPQLELVPETANIGQLVTIEGDGFLGDTIVNISVLHSSSGAFFAIDVLTDAAGSFSSESETRRASGLLTSTGANVSEDDTVTIGDTVYTFKTALTEESEEGEVLIGEYAADSLANLMKAINGEDAWTMVYSLETFTHETVGAPSGSVGDISLIAKLGGTSGNDIPTTTTAAELVFANSTLLGGAEETGQAFLRFAPSAPGVWIIKAEDGVNTISSHLQVFGP